MSLPSLHFGHLCDLAFLSKEGKLNIIGMFEQIAAQRFPVQHQRVTVVSNLTIGAGKHPFRIQIVSPRKPEPLATIAGDLESESERNVNLIADFPQLTLPDQGEYAAEIFVDEEKLTSLRFMVTLVTPNKAS